MNSQRCSNVFCGRHISFFINWIIVLQEADHFLPPELREAFKKVNLVTVQSPCWASITLLNLRPSTCKPSSCPSRVTLITLGTKTKSAQRYHTYHYLAVCAWVRKTWGTKERVTYYTAVRMKATGTKPSQMCLFFPLWFRSHLVEKASLSNNSNNLLYFKSSSLWWREFIRGFKRRLSFSDIYFAHQWSINMIFFAWR